jgi:hypothetical protein
MLRKFVLLNLLVLSGWVFVFAGMRDGEKNLLDGEFRFAPGEILVGFRTGTIRGLSDERGAPAVPLGEVQMPVRVRETFNLLKVMKIEKVFSTFKSSDTVGVSLNGEKCHLPDLSQIVKVYLPREADIYATIAKLKTLEDVLYAEPNGLRGPAFDPNDGRFGSQWGLYNYTYPGVDIGAKATWEMNRGNLAIKIGIVDFGVDYTHKDLGERIGSGLKVGGGYNWTNHSNDPMDYCGHGTHVAGIAAALTNNRNIPSGFDGGVAGVAGGLQQWDTDQGCQIMAFKVEHPDYPCRHVSWEYEAAAITEGAMPSPSGYGCSVLNASLAGPTYSETERMAIMAAHTYGATFVAAKGNWPDNVPTATTPSYPADYDHDWVIAVGNIQINGARYSTSCYSNGLDLVAPGTSIYSTVLNNSFDWYTGTSMSAPHVSGIAGLIYSDALYRGIQLHVDDVEGLLKASCKWLSGYNPNEYGSGLARADSALKLLRLPCQLLHYASTQPPVSWSKIYNSWVNFWGGGLPGGARAYLVDCYEVQSGEVRYSITFSAQPRVWGRGVSATNGWSLANPNYPNYGIGYCTVVPGSERLDRCQFKTYVYYVYGYWDGDQWRSVNTFYPNPPQNVVFQYSVVGRIVPYAPIMISVTPTSDHSLVVDWTDNSNNEGGFKVWRRKDGQSNFVLAGTVPDNQSYFIDSGLECGMRYYYYVKAFNFYGESEPSGILDGTTFPVSISQDLSASPKSSNAIDLNWTDHSNCEAGYRIERSEDGNIFVEVCDLQGPRSGTIYWTDAGLRQGTNYWYRVRAYDSSNPPRFSNYSNVAQARTYVAFTSQLQGATALNGGRKFIYDSRGYFHIAYWDGQNVAYCYSSDKGITWSAPTFFPARSFHDDPNEPAAPAISVETGSSPRVFLTFRGRGLHNFPGIILAIRNPDGSWQNPIDVEIKEFDYLGPPSIAVDGAGRPHLTWEHDSLGQAVVHHGWWDGAIMHNENIASLGGTLHSNPTIEIDADTLRVSCEIGSNIEWAFKAPGTTYWVQDYIRASSNVVNQPSLFASSRLIRCAWEEGATSEIYSADYDRALGGFWTDPIRISNSPTEPSSWPMMLGNYTLWADKAGGQWDIYYSQYIGGEWSPPVNISHSPSVSSKYPHAVFYQYGRPIFNKYLGVTWTEGDAAPYQVLFRSVRLPWDVAYSTSREATGYNNAKRFLADGQGNLYLTYTSKDSVFYITTTDGGDNWSSPLALGPGQSPALNLDVSGNPCATWRKMVGDSLHLYFARRTPSGWSVSEIYSEKPPFIAYLSPPSVAIDRADTAHVLFEYSLVGPVGAWKVYYGNFAVTSPRLMPLAILDSMGMAPDSVPVSPSICVDGRGTVHAVWSDLTGEVQYRKRAQGPWNSKTNLSNSLTASYHPTISSWGPVAVAWQEEVTPGAPEIFYRTIGDSLFSPIQNLSNTPSASSAEPIISGSKVLWVENVNGDNEIYQTQFDSETMAWSAPGSVSTTEALSTHPQAAVSQTEQSTWAYSVWTEEVVPDRAYQILFTGQELPAQPAFALDLGQSQPSPFVVQRDGYIQYGPEPYRSVDYDTTELVYHLTNLNPFRRDKLVLSYYHESSQDWKLKVWADQISLGMVHVPSGQEVVFEKWLPPNVYEDGEVTLRIVRERGDFAVLGKLLVYEYAHGGGGGGPQSTEGALPVPLPSVFALGQSYPNPMRDNAIIQYQLPVESQVSLKVYNVIGQMVRELASGKQKAGYYKAVWKGKDAQGREVSSGVYFYRLDAGGFSKTNKLVVVR